MKKLSEFYKRLNQATSAPPLTISDPLVALKIHITAKR